MQIPIPHFGLSPQNFSLKPFLIFFPKKPCSEKISDIFSKEGFSYISGNSNP